MRFSEALDTMLDGYMVKMRLPWWQPKLFMCIVENEQGKFVCLCNGLMTRKYLPSQAEMLSEDWEQIRDIKEEENLLI